MVRIMIIIASLILMLDKTGFSLDESSEKLIYIDENCDIDKAVKQSLDDAYNAKGGGKHK